MDQLFFHPKIVHLPMALAVLMPFVAGGVLLAWYRGWLARPAWFLVLALQATLVGSGLAALKSGGNEEERVERVVDGQYIEAHQAAAQLFVAASAGVLLLMLLPLARPKRRTPSGALAGAACAGTLIVAGLGIRTGQAGGELVYRHGAAQAYTRPAAASAPSAQPR